MNEKYRAVAKLRVRYSETDQMKIVYNANYFDWFEVARTELCRSLGHPYGEWEKLGVALPVAEAYCRYKIPARYDDEIELCIRVSDVKFHSVKFSYRVVRLEDGKLLAEGWTRHGCVDARGALYKSAHPFYEWIVTAAEDDGAV